MAESAASSRAPAGVAMRGVPVPWAVGSALVPVPTPDPAPAAAPAPAPAVPAPAAGRSPGCSKKNSKPPRFSDGGVGGTRLRMCASISSGSSSSVAAITACRHPDLLAAGCKPRARTMRGPL